VKRFMRVVVPAAAYGIALWMLGIFCAVGGGERPFFVPLVIFSSPLSVVGPPGAILGAPVVWSMWGILLWRRAPRRVLVSILVAHYMLAVAVYLVPWWNYGARAEWEAFDKSGWNLFGLGGVVVFYVAGQLVLWRCAVRSGELQGAQCDPHEQCTRGRRTSGCS